MGILVKNWRGGVSCETAGGFSVADMGSIYTIVDWQRKRSRME
jgi:hypothetical protein